MHQKNWVKHCQTRHEFNDKEGHQAKHAAPRPSLARPSTCIGFGVSVEICSARWSVSVGSRVVKLVCHGLSNDGFCGPADLWLFDCCFDCCREGKDAAWAELDVSTTWDIYGPRWGAMEKSSCIVTICLGKVTYKHSIPYHWLILASGRGLKYD